MPYPSTSPQRSPGRQGPSLPQLVTTIALLTVCCGCPPRPPSQEEQRQAVTSRWITVASVADYSMSIAFIGLTSTIVPVLIGLCAFHKFTRTKLPDTDGGLNP